MGGEPAGQLSRTRGPSRAPPPGAAPPSTAPTSPHQHRWLNAACWAWHGGQEASEPHTGASRGHLEPGLRLLLPQSSTWPGQAAPPRPPSSPPEPKVFPDAPREARSIWASRWERQRRGAWRPRLGGTQGFGAMRSGKGGEWKRQHRNPLGSGEAAYLTSGAPGLRESDSPGKPTEAPGWGSVRYMDKPSKFPSCLARAPSRAVSGVQGPPVAAAPILAHGTHPRPRTAQNGSDRVGKDPSPAECEARHRERATAGGSRSSLPAPHPEPEASG